MAGSQLTGCKQKSRGVVPSLPPSLPLPPSAPLALANES